ncbi:hypothetical protein PI125_g19192 [Phytophthora idaei]|nr:hypothetical protein PI125_g19192 [Phytophthora idaei]
MSFAKNIEIRRVDWLKNNASESGLSASSFYAPKSALEHLVWRNEWPSCYAPSHCGSPPQRKKPRRVQPLTTNPRLKNGTRRAIINTILRASVDGIVPRGVITAIGHQYGRHPTSISRVWDRHLKSEAAGVEGGDHTSHMKENVGRKPHDRDQLVEKIRAVPIQQRQNQRQPAELPACRNGSSASSSATACSTESPTASSRRLRMRTVSRVSSSRSATSMSLP